MGVFRASEVGPTKAVEGHRTSAALQTLIEANADLKFDSVKPVTPESFIEYEKSPQESL